MRVAVFMTHAGHARNFEWTLRLLLEHGHQVHVVCDQEAGELDDRGILESLARDAPGLTVATVSIPESAVSRLSARLRVVVDYLRHVERAAGSDQLRDRAARPIPGTIRRALESRAARRAGVPGALRRALRRVARALPVDRHATAALRALGPDVALIVPLVETGSRQAEHLRAAHVLGIPTCAAVSSWDNLITKGLVPSSPDTLAVWNAAQRREAVEQHGAPADHVAITGAVAYDHWYAWTPTTTREEFCAPRGLDPERAIVLYAGSSAFVAPREAVVALRCVRAIRASGDPAIRDAQIVVRPHPLNAMDDAPLARAELEAVPGVLIDPSRGRNPADLASRTDYFDAMHHSVATVGINTSALLEATIVDRPVHTVLAPEYRDAQLGMAHFHHLLPENGGPLVVSRTEAELPAHLAGDLGDPAASRARNAEFRRRFIRPLGEDVSASAVLTGLLEALGDGKVS